MSTNEYYFIDGFISAVTLMASIHSFLLAAILLFAKRLRSTANRFLVLSLLGVAVILFYESVDYAGAESEIPLVIQYLPLYLRTSIPVGLFFFVVFMIQPQYSLREGRRLWLAFSPLVIELVVELAYIPLPWMVPAHQLSEAEWIVADIGEAVGIITAIIILPLALRRVNRYQTFLYDNYSTTGRRSLGWLRNALLLFLGLTAFWGVAYVQQLIGLDAEDTFLVVTFGLVVVLFWFGYFVILQYDLFQVAPYQDDAPKPAEGPKKLSSKTSVYFQNLLDVLQGEKVFTNPELTLQDLADRLGISAGYLSQIIKEHESKNFFEFINRYRVDAVKQKLVSEDYQHYNIMGIAMESGFKSKSTFNTVFKKFTGQTPSAYKRAHLLASSPALVD